MVAACCRELEHPACALRNTRIDSTRGCFANRKMIKNGQKGDLSEKSVYACTTTHGLGCAKFPLHAFVCCNSTSLLQRLHRWCGKRKCVTGVVRKPFGGGGAFVVAEDMGRTALAAIGFDACLRVPADLIISHARPAAAHRGAQSRCKPRHNRRACAFSLLALGLVFGSVDMQ
jgi:hypothetical protein